jgi:hypothetical protein
MRRMQRIHVIRPRKENAERTTRAKFRQRKARCNCQANPPRHANGSKFTYTKRSILIQDLAGLVQKHRNMAGPNGIYVVFHVLGGR